jgi:hypothetical protein
METETSYVQGDAMQYEVLGDPSHHFFGTSVFLSYLTEGNYQTSFLEFCGWKAHLWDILKISTWFQLLHSLQEKGNVSVLHACMHIKMHAAFVFLQGNTPKLMKKQCRFGSFQTIWLKRAVNWWMTGSAPIKLVTEWGNCIFFSPREHTEIAGKAVQIWNISSHLLEKGTKLMFDRERHHKSGGRMMKLWIALYVE